MNDPRDTAAALARALELPERGVRAVLELTEGGATVPFIARYRKERTGGLDEVAIRAILEAQRARRELAKRREAIEKAIAEQGKLTPALAAALAACGSLRELEDLYAPYKSRRKTRADRAREAGLGPLAARILAQPRDGAPHAEARRFVDAGRGVPDAEAALALARDIVAEELAHRADLRAFVRATLGRHGRVVSKKRSKPKVDPAPWSDYFDHSERADRIAPHRTLALARGEAEGVLSVAVKCDVERTTREVLRRAGHQRRSPFAAQLAQAAADAVKRLLLPAAETAVRADLKRVADAQAITVFGKNLEALLLAPPFGARPVLGVDPGLRTGCKCAVVDATGAFVFYETLQLVHDRGGRAQARLAELIRRHRPAAIAVGNGTGGREALAAARQAARVAGTGAVVVSVNEAGASVYSASEVARAELPDHDVTVRGAVSIARRLQDPLAELVKIDPKSIGVGQYQHDVDQAALRRRLDEVVESCVNRVGVDLNTASVSLLSHVAGLGPKTAAAVVEERTRRGGFSRRRELLEVRGLGPKTYEQCAGFLRIRGGPEPLDASAVHPERYGLVRQMARDLGVSVEALVGDGDAAARVQPERYVGGDVGLPTLRDILAELAKPGRDPRATFEAPAFREDVTRFEDVRAGMILEGVVTNVTDFGAFVDVGVHQDGLVHISKLAPGYVRDPHAVVRPGQLLRVQVLSVDERRRRISLSAVIGAP